METERKDLYEVISGKLSADLVIQNGAFVNVHTKQITNQDVAVHGDRIAQVGDVEHTIGDPTEIVDADEKYVIPGLIEAHLHSHHSYLNIVEFTKLLLEHGVTAFADGFYGPGIVGGMDAIRYCIQEIEKTPLTCLFFAPCIAYQQNQELDISPTDDGIKKEDLEEMVAWSSCSGLEEPTIDLLDDEDSFYYGLFRDVLELNKTIIGHAAGLSERELIRYSSSGVSNDHEMVSVEDVHKRANVGMKQLLRYGSGAPDIPEVVRALTEFNHDPTEFGFCTDMLVCYDIDEVGSVDENIRQSIAQGLNPITAIRMATLNNANILGVSDELGSISPGKKADIILANDLRELDINTVISNGKIVHHNNRNTYNFENPEYPDWTLNTLSLKNTINQENFAVKIDEDNSTALVRTIVVSDGTFVTTEGEAYLDVDNGKLQTDPDRDILKAAMVDRHEGNGRTGLGYVEGFGLEAGALGISVNPGRENIVVVGTNDADITTAVNKIFELQGGAVYCKNGEIMAEVPLKIFGMQSKQSGDETINGFTHLIETIEKNGCELTSPIANLEFICPAHIPSLRISDYGLIEVPSGEQKEIMKNQ